MTLINKTI